MWQEAKCLFNAALKTYTNEAKENENEKDGKKIKIKNENENENEESVKEVSCLDNENVHPDKLADLEVRKGR